MTMAAMDMHIMYSTMRCEQETFFFVSFFICEFAALHHARPIEVLSDRVRHCGKEEGALGVRAGTLQGDPHIFVLSRRKLYVTTFLLQGSIGRHRGPGVLKQNYIWLKRHVPSDANLSAYGFGSFECIKS